MLSVVRKTNASSLGPILKVFFTVGSESLESSNVAEDGSAGSTPTINSGEFPLAFSFELYMTLSLESEMMRKETAKVEKMCGATSVSFH